LPSAGASPQNPLDSRPGWRLYPKYPAAEGFAPRSPMDFRLEVLLPDPTITPYCEFLTTPLRGELKILESNREELGKNVEKHWFRW